MFKIFIFFSFILLTSCEFNGENKILSTLQNGEANVSFKINGKEFYDRHNVFSGDVLVLDQVFRINLYDQFKSNFILSFEEKNKYIEKPYVRNIVSDNQIAGSVMAGKLADTLSSNTGIGYLLAEGIVEVKKCDAEKMQIKVKGNGAKFNSFNVPDKWEKIEAEIIIKKPRYIFEGVLPNEFYYVQ